MNRNKFKYLIFIFLSAIIIYVNYIPAIKGIYQTPTYFKFFEGEKVNFNFNLPLKVGFYTDKKGIVKIINNDNKNILNLGKPFSVETLNRGKVNINFKLFGILPIKNVSVDVIPTINVIPGGQSIGVRLNTKGALVVGYSDIIGTDDRIYSPYREGKIQIGDIILEVNNIKISCADDITNIINNQKGLSVTLKINRKGNIVYAKIHPVLAKEDEKYKLGLWVRDHTAGIGTLTFYSTDKRFYAALGHAITDVDTGDILSVNNGQIMKSRIISINKGKRSSPGELRGIFLEEVDNIGNIEKNTEYGIYGKVYNNINDMVGKPIPIGYQSQVKEGSAKILTTIDNTGVKEFDIQIVKKVEQKNPNQKGMIIKVVDKDLLNKTGGIVQGMSGSPIIQNGKLIGAVTHVFVNDPSKGYAVYAEWMINEMKNLQSDKNVFYN
ncbi:SpoIVB peptidase [Thermoanaerobacterium thermosaccharolyticum]|uniref:Stage IV sporulation protein B n=1 Tax=Thermoanaerobacterium thermosaccharolyticum M0795 TaxID=698948 RepID=L0ILT3_THETR|nr:SpoIVB peptidase [Thermoanaerobacterium thermosaccharolyticum]AGB18927.1 stage IV sporulation protein B [Thermoanaerobacterium thermosaccharolyticum M0795]